MNIKLLAATLGSTLFLLSCGSDTATMNDTAAEVTAEQAAAALAALSITGNSRILKVAWASAARFSDVKIYQYDDYGRLKGGEMRKGSEVYATWTNTYSDDGRLLTYAIEFVSEYSRDEIRNYLYEENRIAGYIHSVGGIPRLVVQYTYAGERITGYEQRTLDPLIPEPTLSDGELNKLGFYTYDDVGRISNLDIQFAGGQNDTNIIYTYNSLGQRTETRAYDRYTFGLFTEQYEYEDAPCMEIPDGMIDQWVCVELP